MAQELGGVEAGAAHICVRSALMPLPTWFTRRLECCMDAASLELYERNRLDPAFMWREAAGQADCRVQLIFTRGWDVDALGHAV